MVGYEKIGYQSAFFQKFYCIFPLKKNIIFFILPVYNFTILLYICRKIFINKTGWYMKFPIGIQNFESLRNDNYAYVDKTAQIYKLAVTGRYYFLSRPRRFGKSLLISTLEAYFSGKKDLFAGLTIEKMESLWTEYPILHLDLNSRLYENKESLQAELNKHLEIWERRYGDEFKDRALEERFYQVIIKAYEQTGQRVVILVDEYDKPMLQSIGNEMLQDEYRNILKAFYSVLKTLDRYIRFAFLTGVTKFGKVSVFSDLNNLNDISMDRRYIDICGITEKEIHTYFENSLHELTDATGSDYDTVCDKLRQLYDGYHFTGTVSFGLLNSINSMSQNPIPVIYQSGYLTIKEYDETFKTYRLGFPNMEVENGFIKYLTPFYTPIKENETQFFIVNFVRDIEQGRPDAFMERMQTMFDDTSYQIAGRMEIYFQNSMYLIFKMLGFYTEVERTTSRGRIDIVMKTRNYIYVIEIKLDGTPDEALQQIETRGYAAPFVSDGRKVYKIGVNFSSATRGVEEWKIAE